MDKKEKTITSEQIYKGHVVSLKKDKRKSFFLFKRNKRKTFLYKIF